MIVDIEQLVPNGTINGNGNDNDNDNELRFDETDYYFLENGREIFVIIEPERYDVTDCTWNGLRTLFFIREFYFYKEYDMSFRAFVNTMLDDYENVEMFHYLTQADVDSIFDALFDGNGVPTKWYYDIITFFLNYWYDIKRGYYDLQEKYASITEWFKSDFGVWKIRIPYKDIFGVEHTIKFDVDFKIVAPVLLGIMGTYFGYLYMKSYAIERGEVEAKAIAPIGEQIKKVEKSVKKKLKKVI